MQEDDDDVTVDVESDDGDGQNETGGRNGAADRDESDLVHVEGPFEPPMEPASSASAPSASSNTGQTANSTATQASSSSTSSSPASAAVHHNHAASTDALNLVTHRASTRESGVQTTLSVLAPRQNILLPEDLKHNLECPVCSRM